MEMWNDWIKGKDKSKLTEAQANEFLDKVKNSSDPRIKDFLKDMHDKAEQIKKAKTKLKARLCKLLGIGASALGAASATSAIAGNPNLALAMQAASEGDIGGVDEAMFDLAVDIAEAGGSDAYLATYGLYEHMK